MLDTNAAAWQRIANVQVPYVLFIHASRLYQGRTREHPWAKTPPSGESIELPLEFVKNGVTLFPHARSQAAVIEGCYQNEDLLHSITSLVVGLGRGL